MNNKAEFEAWLASLPPATAERVDYVSAWMAWSAAKKQDDEAVRIQHKAGY